MSGEDEHRDWSDAPTTHRAPQIASCHQKLEHTHETNSPTKISERTNHDNNLISDFSPP